MFNERAVDGAMGMLRRFAKEHGVDRPSMILLAHGPFEDLEGVALQWDRSEGPLRTAVRCAAGHNEDLIELKRRLESW